MKKLILLVLVLLVGGIYAQPKQNDLEKEGLKGKVKRFDDGHWNSFYNENGFLQYSESDMYRTDYTYDEKGNRLFSKTIYKKTGQETWSNAYTYVGNSVLIKKKKYERGYTINDLIEVFENSKKVYDNKGNEKEIYYADGHRVFFSYNDQNLPLEKNVYDAKETFKFRQTYIYNDQGKMIEDFVYNEKKKLESRSTYKYDDKGNVIEQLDFEGTKKKPNYERFYSYQYDQKGNIVEQVEKSGSKKNKEKSIKTTIYKYDEQGNWVYKKENERESKRIIEYY